MNVYLRSKVTRINGQLVTSDYTKYLTQQRRLKCKIITLSGS